MDWAKVTDPKTGDRIIVFQQLSNICARFYQINDCAPRPVPTETLKKWNWNLLRVALDLMSAEKSTLP